MLSSEFKSEKIFYSTGEETGRDSGITPLAERMARGERGHQEESGRFLEGTRTRPRTGSSQEKCQAEQECRLSSVSSTANVESGTRGIIPDDIKHLNDTLLNICCKIVFLYILLRETSLLLWTICKSLSGRLSSRQDCMAKHGKIGFFGWMVLHHNHVTVCPYLIYHQGCMRMIGLQRTLIKGMSFKVTKGEDLQLKVE